MIISRTPLRLSFFGGGTDYPVWYRDNPGAVISASINKYSFISVRYLPPFFDYKHRIRYYQNEEVDSIDQIKHPSVRECAKLLGIDKGLEIVHTADLPARSGLGSSSAFTVGMLNALSSLQSKMIAKRELAVKAINIEQNIIGEHVGSQDQVASAFGGFNFIRFNRRQEIEVDPIIIPEHRLIELQDHLLLCFTGFARTASDIAKRQIELTEKKHNELHEMNSITQNAFDILVDEKEPIANFGKLLSDQWNVKKTMTDKISNRKINDIYDAGIEGGAIGGKLLGAGSGGFMLFFVKPELHEKVKAHIGEKLFVPFRFDYTGSKIIYHSHEGY